MKRLNEAVTDKLPSFAIGLADAISERTEGRFDEQIKGQAEAVGVDWRRLMLGNVTYDLSLAIMGCSVVVLESGEGPVVARNFDWWPPELLAQTTILARAFRGDRLDFALACWPGSVGVVTAVSTKGFAIALNAVPCPEGRDLSGYPITFHLRRVIDDAKDFDDALRMIAEEHLMVGCLVVVAGTENDQRAVVERTPTEHAIRRAEPGRPLVVTNHYAVLDEPKAGTGNELYETTLARAEALERRFEGAAPDRAWTDDELLGILSAPDIIEGCTVQQVVMRPRTGGIKVGVPRSLLEPASEQELAAG